MKFIIINFLFILMACGCEIEEKIDKAASRCEEKISKVLESIEGACLTKEEILELIRSAEEAHAPDTDYIEDVCP